MGEKEFQNKERFDNWAFAESRIHITPGDIGNSGQTPKCGSYLIRRSSLKIGDVPSATSSSRFTLTSFPTTSIPAAWEGHGETIIPTTFRPSTGGATGKKDRAECDGGLVGCRSMNTPSPRFAGSPPISFGPKLPPYNLPTRSKIIRARLTLSDTTAVRRGDGRLISGSRARRTAAMIAAAMTSVDFIRVCSCIFSSHACRSRAIARFISPIGTPLVARALYQVCTRACLERSRMEDSSFSRRRADTVR